MKEVVIVGGANGSGKTTFSELLVEEMGYEFLNADEIEKTLVGLNPSVAKIRAGRILFEQLAILKSEGKSFIIESTLAGNYLINTIQTLKKEGYKVSYKILESL